MNLEKNRRILVIDDNRAIHEDFRKILASHAQDADLEAAEAKLLGAPAASSTATEAFEVASAYQGLEGLEMVRASVAADRRYAMAFVDMRMPPGWDGVETIAYLWEVDPEIQIVICTAYTDYSWDEINRRLGNVDRFLILKKPFDTVEVCQLASALTQKWYLARHLNQLREELERKTASLQAEVLERRKSEEELRRAQVRYALALAGANDGIWDWDFTTQTAFYSSRWKAMLGAAEGTLPATSDAWFDRIHPDDLDRVKSELNAHLEGRSDQFCSEHRMMHSDGEYRWMLSRGVAVRDEHGTPLRAAGSQTDITDRKLAESQLRHDAMHDGLTGLANRKLLMDRINQCLQRTLRLPGQQFAVIFLDLDRFKVINDSLGHAAGDQLLIALATRLEAALRAADTVARGDTDHLARLGGDEFVALLDCVRSPSDAIRVAERLQLMTAHPFSIKSQEVFVAASIGIAMSNQDYEKPEDILRDADAALYDAKSGGGGGCCMFDPKMHASAMARLVMETELRRALERGELRLHYQPVQSLASGRVVGVEALVRWEHPQRGMIPPLDFISLAEETGLILPIGRWVLSEACRQTKQWQTQLPALGDFSVAVNVSGRQFARVEMPQEVAAVLRDTGLDASCLKLEITESVIMESADAAIAELNALRDMGVQIHLDDFGTGYSSLAYLQRMPIEALKMDRTFVSALGDRRTGTPIVEAIVGLARSLGMSVVAEGVENASQADFLRGLGCEFAQGYHFARPLTPEQFVQFASGGLAAVTIAKRTATSAAA